MTAVARDQSTPPSYDAVKRMLAMGFDTVWIARYFRVSEATIYNILVRGDRQ